MSDSVAGSPSPVLRATHILAIDIATATPTPWAGTTAGWNERHIALGGMLLRVLKGRVSEAPGSRFAADIVQLRNPSPLDMPVPGVWTEIEITPGTEFLIFAATAQAVPPAGTLLSEPPCIHVSDAAELPSTVLMLRHLRGELPAEAFLAALPAAHPGFLFVELLDELLRRPDFIAHDAFRLVLALVTDAGLPMDVRAGLISAVVNAPGLSDLYTGWHLDQIVIALFRAGLDPRSGELRENILSIDLPSLVGLDGGEPRSAAQVFHEQPALRRQFLGLARAPGALPAAKKLIGWLSKD